MVQVSTPIQCHAPGIHIQLSFSLSNIQSVINKLFLFTQISFLLATIDFVFYKPAVICNYITQLDVYLFIDVYNFIHT